MLGKKFPQEVWSGVEPRLTQQNQSNDEETATLLFNNDKAVEREIAVDLAECMRAKVCR